MPPIHLHGRYCYPLTISDAYSRYLVRCEALKDGSTPLVKRIFESAFEQYGIPERIRTDNGVPFASRSVVGLSKLSVYMTDPEYPLEFEFGRADSAGRIKFLHHGFILAHV